MTDSARQALQAVLAQNFTVLRRKLARRLGSQNDADEALHEAWLKLASGGDLKDIEQKEAYLLRAAMNIATSRLRDDRRRLDRAEIEGLLRVNVDDLDPERALLAKDDLKILAAAMAELPSRRHDILVAARFHGRSTQDIADELGLNVRFVQRELIAALQYLSNRLGKKFDGLRRKSGDEPSYQQDGTPERDAPPEDSQA